MEDGRYHFTPLIHAVNKGDLPMTRLLINLGANLNRVNSDGYSYLRYGLNYIMGDYNGYYSSEMKKLLFDTELCNIVHDLDYFFAEIKIGNMYNIKRILSSTLDINMKSKNGNTLLHEAVRNKKPEIVKLLIEKGIDKQIKNNEGESAYELNEKMNKNDTKESDTRENNENLNMAYSEIRNLLY
ncbi:hypothetical protein PIROE2DRAFT_66691 [Piromyces sp. E2]|nr:hypothetical protein PIROE2DRAFT_66691 [Piromyces sp. E2]|eukprot:OUM70570.1 hypothetical protein PIROE2DRAFT_66691 [Piromyces sp. E2]